MTSLEHCSGQYWVCSSEDKESCLAHGSEGVGCSHGPWCTAHNKWIWDHLGTSIELSYWDCSCRPQDIWSVLSAAVRGLPLCFMFLRCIHRKALKVWDQRKMTFPADWVVGSPEQQSFWFSYSQSYFHALLPYQSGLPVCLSTTPERPSSHPEWPVNRT